MIEVDRKLCPHDHVCPLIRLCPVRAITQGSDGYPVIDHDKCIECARWYANARIKRWKSIYTVPRCRR